MMTGSPGSRPNVAGVADAKAEVVRTAVLEQLILTDVPFVLNNIIMLMHGILLSSSGFSLIEDAH
ncbi:hypothetical protein [Listeria welshimeri]|uniref:hypothetical protein n=1 Tax=Listeria welshimeri TaxID=1643 RepID=UPI0018870E72|nr:hypothetical protein [Listeria welshimeri]MBF2463454.1 hypothetical protein [Listeria welshimeri]